MINMKFKAFINKKEKEYDKDVASMMPLGLDQTNLNGHTKSKLRKLVKETERLGGFSQASR